MQATHPPRLFVDQKQVRRNFSRVAADYDKSALLPREIAARMLERLDYVRLAPQRILDLGCGTGASLSALRERYADAQLIGADLSESMLLAGKRAHSRLRWLLPFMRAGKTPLLVADASVLPFRAGSMNLLWSNLMLHWLDNPVLALREMHRVLAVDGLLMFSSLGPDTLKELRASFDDGYPHTQRFADMHDLGDMLVECGFADPVMDMEVLTVTYASFDDLLAELRRNGAACAMQERRRSLTGRKIWDRARARYEQWRTEGRLPATLEIVYGHAWKAAPKKTEDGRAIIRFERTPLR